MVTINTRFLGDLAMLDRQDFDRLVELARRTEEIHLRIPEDELSTKEVMHLAEDSHGFDFWKEPEEDIYTTQDGEPV